MIMPVNRLEGLDSAPVEYRKSAVISTGHLPRSVAEEWEIPITGDVANEILYRTGVCIPYGYMMCLPSEWIDEEIKDLPLELLNICEWALAFCDDDTTHIVFDRDGPRVPLLPFYEW